jgi:hypothetical protein
VRIDEAIAETKPLQVSFGGGAVLNIEYRPPAYTIAQMTEAAADKGNPERLISMIQDLVVGWDLTRTEMRVVEPNGDPVPFEIPVDINNDEDVRLYVPTTIITGIVKAVRADNDPSGE